MVNNHGIIIHKVGYKKGRRHDYDIYKKNHPVTPKEVVNVFDLGISWHRKGFPRTTIISTNKKKRNHAIIRRAKRINKNHSKKRIVIETYHLSIEKV